MDNYYDPPDDDNEDDVSDAASYSLIGGNFNAQNWVEQGKSEKTTDELIDEYIVDQFLRTL